MPGMIASLIPAPLHPAVVHMPMALAVLAPIFAVGAFVAVRRGAKPMRSWSLAVAIFLALTASAWASIATGEQQEERVERIVPEAAFDAHEEAAERFLWLSLAVTSIALAGLTGGRIGTSARITATVGSAMLLVAGYQVGHSGGELVYVHGAPTAFIETAGASTRRDARSPGASEATTSPGTGDDDAHRR